MKTIQSSKFVDVPANVSVKIKARTVTVTGPRGTLTKSFKHANLEIRKSSPSKIQVRVWFGNRKQLACVRTVASHIKNMVNGVTIGFRYLMRSAYSHFPINLAVLDEGKTIQIGKYLGGEVVKKIPMLEGVVVALTGQKDEISLIGNDIEKVSHSGNNVIWGEIG